MVQMRLSGHQCSISPQDLADSRLSHLLCEPHETFHCKPQQSMPSLGGAACLEERWRMQTVSW